MRNRVEERNKKTVGKRHRLQDIRRQGRGSAGRATSDGQQTGFYFCFARHLTTGTSYKSVSQSKFNSPQTVLNILL